MPSGIWLFLIMEHILINIKLILALPQPLTLARLSSLAWSDITDGGVFIWRFKPNRKQVSVQTTGYLYIGSAYRYYYGLSGRRRRLLLPSLGRREEALISKIKRLDLSPDGEFITLFTVPFKNGSFNDIENVKALVILARMVLIIWLGAINERWKPAIKDLVPCGLEHIKYLGLAGDNPLATNFKGQRWNKEERNHEGAE